MTRPAKFRVRTPEEHAAYMANRKAHDGRVASVLKQVLDADEAGEPLPTFEDYPGDYVDDESPDTPAAPPVVRRADLTGTGWTRERQRAFIAHLADHGCVGDACDAIALSKQSAYALRRRGGRTMFAFAWDVAIRTARKRLLDEATERALAGREVAVWHRGEQVGMRTVYNDRMLMFLLSLKPEPLHAEHDDATLAQLWPVMLDLIDTEVPFSPEVATALLDRGDQCRNGNDRDRQ